MTMDVKLTKNLKDDIQSVLFSQADLDKIVSRIANEITERYAESVLVRGEKLVIVGILNGAFQFMSDLVKKINLPIEIEFMFASSYGAGTISTGKVNVKVGKNPSVLEEANNNIVIVEDIIDSGNTLAKLLEELNGKGCKSVALCALFDKFERRETYVNVDFLGEKVPDEFIVGYGLDYNEKYRNLPYVGILKREIYE